MTSNRKDLTDSEIQTLNELIDSYIKPQVFKCGKDAEGPVRYDKRENMYAGDGTVYLLQLFRENELVNNRIGAYMVLPTKNDSVGFHTHGARNEQELYIVIKGFGIYREKESEDGESRDIRIEPGSVTSIRGKYYHSVENSSDEPLIIFVITTNEPKN